MKPEANALHILSTTQATAKMHEFRVAPEDFIELPRNPAMLFPLAVGLLGDVAAVIGKMIRDGVDVHELDLDNAGNSSRMARLSLRQSRAYRCSGRRGFEHSTKH